MVRHPEASPCKIKSAGSPLQMPAALASQLRLNISAVLELQGLTKYKCSAGSRSKDDETDKESDYHKTVGI